MDDPVKQYDFVNLVKEYHNLSVNDPKNKITPHIYFQNKKDILESNESAQNEKQKQIEIVCKTMYGLDKLDEATTQIGTIQDQLTDLKTKNSDMANFENQQRDTLNVSKKYLLKYLFLSHLANIQRMPYELYQKLKSGKHDEIQNANETIKSFTLLYQKHPNKLHIDKIINNEKLIKAAKDLIFAFDTNMQFNPKSIDSRKQIEQNIENSVNATAFLMNYYLLFNLSQTEKKDPFDIFGIFLFSWKEKISKLRGNIIKGETPPFTSEIETYLRAKFILNQIDPRNNNFADKLVPSILYENRENEALETELYKRFSGVERDVINSFYYVHDHSFSGSFFNNYTIDIAQINELFGSDKFEKMSFFTVAYIIEMEKHIKSIVNNLQVQNNIESIIQHIPTEEFKSDVAKDVSNILLYYFDHKNLEPSMMLMMLFKILFIDFSKYYDMVPDGSSSPLAVIICMCDACQLLPYIRSAWSNYLLTEFEDERNRNNEILFIARNKINEIIGELTSNKTSKNNSNPISNTICTRFEKYQSFYENLKGDNIYSGIIDSFAGIIVQKYIEIQNSLSVNRNSLELIKHIIQKLGEQKLNQRTRDMITWVSTNIDEIP